MHPLNESKIDNHLCTAISYNDDNEERKIKCTKCKRSVHVVCTNLPMYQLHLFFTKNYREFICVNCVKVSKEFQELFKKQGESMIDTYKLEVGACENIIMVQKIIYYIYVFNNNFIHIHILFTYAFTVRRTIVYCGDRKYID